MEGIVTFRYLVSEANPVAITEFKDQSETFLVNPVSLKKTGVEATMGGAYYEKWSAVGTAYEKS